MIQQKITHRFLCERGSQWLKTVKNFNYRCQYVLIEFCSVSSENPDLYGLRGHLGICVEVKVSKADFKKDLKKPHRSRGGIGFTRYYLCPKDMVKPDEVQNGWGLVEYNPEDDSLVVIKKSESFHQRDFNSELNLMQSVIRRLAGKPQILDFRKQKDQNV